MNKRSRVRRRSSRKNPSNTLQSRCVSGGKRIVNVAKRYFSLVVIVAVIALVYFIPSVITVRAIDCNNQFGECSRQVKDLIASSEGESIRTAKNTINQTLGTYSRVREHSVRYMFPNKLTISCIESTAQFALENPDYGTIALLDSEGVVMELVEESVLPSVVSTEQLSDIGEQIPRDVLFAVSLAKQLRSSYEMAEFTIEDSHLKVTGIDAYTVYFPLMGDKDVLLGRLVLILSRLKQSEEEFRIEEDLVVTEIDLRYKNPVLR